MEPVTAADVMAVLVAAAAGFGDALLSRPITAGGAVDLWWRDWRVLLALDQNCWPVQVLEAVAPDGRRWEWGCQRHWLVDGAPVVSPLDLMAVEQLVDVMPLMGVLPAGEIGWPDFEAVARRQLNIQRSARKGRRKSSVRKQGE